MAFEKNENTFIKRQTEHRKTFFYINKVTHRKQKVWHLSKNI